MDPAAPSAHCIWLGQERTQLEPDGAGAEAQDRWKYWSRMVGIDSGSGDSSEVSMGCEAEKRASGEVSEAGAQTTLTATI